MAIKPRLFAQLEAVQAALRKNPGMVMTWEYHTNMATAPDGRTIDIAKDFPLLTSWRTPAPWGNAIDEHWIVDAAVGAATIGTRALARVPGMCTLYAVDYIFHQAGKWRHMSGGQSGLPVTIWQDGIGRTPGLAGQHSDSGEEGLWAYLPGLITVVPTTTYDAKGLMNAALAADDPVLYFDYGSLAAL